MTRLHVTPVQVFKIKMPYKQLGNRICSVIVIILASSVVGCVFEPPLDHTKDNKIGVFCFSAKHAASR